MYDQEPDAAPVLVEAIPPEGYPPHKLFPRAPVPKGEKPGPELRDIYEIQIDRWDHSGRKERHPDRFPAAELSSWADIVGRWGGGTYQLAAVGRDCRFSAWTEHPDTGEAFYSPEPCRPFWKRAGTHHAPPPPAPPAPPSPAAPSAEPKESMAERMMLATVAGMQTMVTSLVGALAGRAQVPPTAAGADPIQVATSVVGLASKLGRGGTSAVDELGKLMELQRKFGGGADADDPLLKVLMPAMMGGAGTQQQAPAPNGTGQAATAPGGPQGTLAQVYDPHLKIVVWAAPEAAAKIHAAAQARGQAPTTKQELHRPAGWNVDELAAMLDDPARRAELAAAIKARGPAQAAAPAAAEVSAAEHITGEAAPTNASEERSAGIVQPQTPTPPEVPSAPTEGAEEIEIPGLPFKLTANQMRAMVRDPETMAKLEGEVAPELLQAMRARFGT
jgi:hypothetical protein